MFQGSESATVLHLQAGTDKLGKGSNHSLKWGACLDKTGDFFTDSRYTTELQKEPCS